jgi:hypothetical protein
MSIYAWIIAHIVFGNNLFAIQNNSKPNKETNHSIDIYANWKVNMMKGLAAIDNHISDEEEQLQGLNRSRNLPLSSRYATAYYFVQASSRRGINQSYIKLL